MDESDIDDIKNKVDDSSEGSTDEPGIDNNDLSDDDGDDNPFGGDEEDTIEEDFTQSSNHMYKHGEVNGVSTGLEFYDDDNNQELYNELYELDEDGGEGVFTNSIESNGNKKNDDENLLFSEKNHTFVENDDDMIQELVDAMFNSDPTPTVPVREPVVKPGTDEPYVKPIKPSQKPFSPGRRIHEDPQPKAKL